MDVSNELMFYVQVGSKLLDRVWIHLKQHLDTSEYKVKVKAGNSQQAQMHQTGGFGP